MTGSGEPDDLASTTEQLRAEIISAQSARTDLLKYKLVVCAVIGAVAIGTGPSAGAERFPYVVGLVPFVCLYIDAVCNHNDLRILVIGRFLERNRPNTLASRYEHFAGSLRGVFSLESIALNVSTVAFSLAIAAVGFARLFAGDDDDSLLLAIEMSSGAVGVVGSVLLTRRTRTLAQRIAQSHEADTIDPAT